MNAIRLANKYVKDNDLTWEKLISNGHSSSKPPPARNWAWDNYHYEETYARRNRKQYYYEDFVNKREERREEAQWKKEQSSFEDLLAKAGKINWTNKNNLRRFNRIKKQYDSTGCYSKEDEIWLKDQLGIL